MSSRQTMSCLGSVLPSQHVCSFHYGACMLRSPQQTVSDHLHYFSLLSEFTHVNSKGLLETAHQTSQSTPIVHIAPATTAAVIFRGKPQRCPKPQIWVLGAFGRSSAYPCWSLCSQLARRSQCFGEGMFIRTLSCSSLDESVGL